MPGPDSTRTFCKRGDVWGHVCVSLSLSLSLYIYIYIHICIYINIYIYISTYILVLVLEEAARTSGTLALGLCRGAQGMLLYWMARTASPDVTHTSHSWEEDLPVPLRRPNPPKVLPSPSLDRCLQKVNAVASSRSPGNAGLCWGRSTRSDVTHAPHCQTPAPSRRGAK